MTPQVDLAKPRTPLQYLRLFFTGIAMGASDIVPGVSGGTMAFILGVYEDLIDGIKSFDLTAIRLALSFRVKDFLNHVPLQFLVALGLGILSAVVLLSGFLSRTLDDEAGRILLFAFFFGLVMASIVTIGFKVKWGIIPGFALLSGIGIALIVVNAVPTDAPHEPLNLFLSGMVAICAMILPGISGAFILLILGQYDYVLTAVSERNLLPIVMVALGSVVGLMMFSRVLSYLLKHYYQATVAALVGFMVGSLWRIWPWKACLLDDVDRHGELRCLQEVNQLPDFASPEFLTAFSLTVFGFLLVNLIDHVQHGQNPVFRWMWRPRGSVAA
ncbi:MAG: DUF368 domain-containing protein [Anaerolineaceae bacterium]|nr:DUF368 domain-containing protein [Anaerolineaceae bacterium]